MFEAGGDTDAGSEALPLISPDGGGSHHGVHIGVFAVPLGNTSPATVAGYVDHRGEGPLDSRTASLCGGHGAGPGGKTGVERTGLSERYLIDCAEAVDYVLGENRRNSKACLRHDAPLEAIAETGIGAVIDI